MNTHYDFLIGLDWADMKHDLVVRNSTGTQTHCVVESSPEAIEQWLVSLRQKNPDASIAICLEQNRGPVFYLLSKYDFIDLYQVNPGAMAHYRKAFAPSGSKNDKMDATLLLDLLVRHRESLRLVEPDREDVRELARLCEGRRKCVNERTRHGNALKSLLKLYFPQALDLCGSDLYGPLSLDFLTRWPTLEAFQHARKKTVEDFLSQHRAREKRIDRSLEIHDTARCAITDNAVIAPSLLTLQTLIDHLRADNKAVARFDEAIKVNKAKNADMDIFESFPGAGAAMAPRLAIAFGSRRERFTSPDQAQAYFGVSPVTESSGKGHWVHWRWSCPKFLRQTFVEYSKESIRFSPWARAYYDHARAHGKTHQKALRALAWKWVRILWRCWQSRETYDEERYMAALKKNGSWLASEVKEAA